MSKLKLFGNKRKSRTAKASQSPRRTSGLRGVVTILLLLAFVEGMYFLCVYSNNAFISKWRNIYIQTAMSTMSHQWLATAFIPNDIIWDIMAEQEAAMEESIGQESQWGGTSSTDDPETEDTSDETETAVTKPVIDKDEAAFYELFWELDRDSMEAYLKKNPEVLDNGWENIYINEAGLDDKGTDIYTTFGEQVLALDAYNEILVLRVSGTGYRGVLSVAKDPTRLSVENSAGLGSYGQTAGSIAKANNGILSMTGSGFIDEDGAGNGGILAGYAMSNGQGSGTAHMGWSYKRIELREDNRLYIVDAQNSVNASTTDAVEFIPAIIIDGVTMSNFSGYTALNPRAAIGQSKDEEILMLVIEGRLVTSLGVDVAECAKIFERHNAMQAMNLDGGTSAIMWYDGEYITQCSNTAIPEGRTLPNAFVYGAK